MVGCSALCWALHISKSGDFILPLHLLLQRLTPCEHLLDLWQDTESVLSLQAVFILSLVVSSVPQLFLWSHSQTVSELVKTPFFYPRSVLSDKFKLLFEWDLSVRCELSFPEVQCPQSSTHTTFFTPQNKNFLAVWLRQVVTKDFTCLAELMALCEWWLQTPWVVMAGESSSCLWILPFARECYPLPPLSPAWSLEI